MNCEYSTSKGRKYSFVGWGDGGSPVERFDNAEYVLCLHASMFAASFLPAEEARLLLEDDQLLHELVHIIQGVDESSITPLPNIRKSLIRLEKRFKNEVTKNL